MPDNKLPWVGLVVNVYVRNVDDGVWRKFIIYVISKYGKLRGVLGREVSEALRFYLEAMEESDKARGVQG